MLTLGGPPAAWWNMSLAVVVNVIIPLMLSERGARLASASWVPLTLREEHALEYPCPRDVMLDPTTLKIFVFLMGRVCARA